MPTNTSTLVLGTAQLGMVYGLNNSHGQPTIEEAFAILDAAYAAGITVFDTAYGYGTAENVLGSWIQARGMNDNVSVISKMKPHVLNDYPDGTPASEVVQRELKKSLARLHVKQLDGYLLHSPYYVYLAHVVTALRKVQEGGLVKRVGVSVYDEAEALQAVELGVDYVQAPYNVFDQRLDATAFFGHAKKNNITIFARSPFLQGVLLMRPEQLPKHLTYLRPYLEHFIDISARYHLSPLEAALFFVGARCPAARIVFGVETVHQLTQVVNAWGKQTSFRDHKWIPEMQEVFKNLNRGAINPSLWSMIRP